jgi:cytoskeletal protein CcmA (bactofilin family)
MRPGPPTDAFGAADRSPIEAKDARAANLGRSVFVKGEVTGSEDLTLDGQVEGRIDLPNHMLTIGPNATIVADISANVVLVFGSVIGSITVRDKVDVRRGGSVEGNLTCARIAIQDGANFCAKVDMPSRRRSETGDKTELAAVALAPVA